MTPREALVLLEKAARSINANADVHDQLREAVRVLATELALIAEPTQPSPTSLR
jgi:hypothetical protein